jgi:phytoene dehydrogenase-like protein
MSIPMPKKVVIIGAGIAGLSTGCYAQNNGYETEIYEAHTLPGGLCTAWKRKGYVIDGCIHWLTGSGPGNSFYQVWHELGVLPGLRMVDHSAFFRFTGLDGRTFVLYADPDRLERHMKELSPGDAPAIEEFCRLVRRLSVVGLPVGQAPELMGPWDALKTIFTLGPYMKDLMTISRTTLAEFGARFQDPLLRQGITQSLYDGNTPLLALVMTLGPMSRKAAGFPIGGSLEFSRRLERRFLGLGGKTFYRSKVVKILEKDGLAVGVKLADGREVAADHVVSAADMKATLYSMLDGSRVHDLHLELMERTKLMDPCVQVTFGVDLDFSEDCDMIGEAFELSEPLEVAGRRREWFGLKNYSYDPSLAPAGRSVVNCFLPTDWEYWERFTAEDPGYQAEKEKIAAACADAIEGRYPGFKKKIEVTDVATPLTFARYTGSWKGTFMTWMLGPDFQRKHPFVPKTVPGLGHLWLASMWTKPPGGLPGAAKAGREVVQLICRQDHRRFKADTMA